MIQRLQRRIANMVARAIVGAVNDSTQMQLVQLELSDDETRDRVERFQNYGFTSHPQPGAEAVVVFVGGARDHGLAIAVDDRRYRIVNLASGEVAMYTDQGDSIVIKRGGTIQINAATAVELTGNTAHVAKGESLNSAIATLGTVIAGAFTTMATATPGAVPITQTQAAAAAVTIGNAVTAFGVSAAAALSTKVKVG